jgi:signal transduction histidine kinase
LKSNCLQTNSLTYDKRTLHLGGTFLRHVLCRTIGVVLKTLNDITTKQRIWLIYLVIFVGFILIFLIALHEYNAIVETTRQRTLSLMSITSSSKGEKIQRLIQTYRIQLRLLSHDSTLLEGFEKIKEGFDTFLPPPDPQTQEKETAQRAEKARNYLKQSLRSILNLEGKSLDINKLVPLDWRALTLQEYYVIDNLASGLARSNFQMAEDGSEYSKAHGSIQSYMQKNMLESGVEDIMMVDKEGNVIYTTVKELGFGTNLYKGPFQDTLFATLVKSILKESNPAHAEPRFTDFSFYLPSLMQPRAFLAIPLFKENENIGALVFKIGNDKINQITFGDWGREENKGMEETGEVFVIGGDYKMRSNSRFLVQEPEKYFRQCIKANIPVERIIKMQILNTTALIQEDRSSLVRKAFFSAGAAPGMNYFYQPSLVGFFPLDIEEVQWAVMAEITEKEVLGPIEIIRNQFMISSGIILLSLILSSALLIFYINKAQLQTALEGQVQERTRELKEAQNQLIQKEKMASLGMLTTGIAHEIENPLNFVINFSDLSNGIVDELQQSVQNPKEEQGMNTKIKESLTVLKDNLNIISKHGKKADIIVKRMLEHSTGGPGAFEFKDIHRLITETINIFYTKITPLQDFKILIEKDFDLRVKGIEISARDFQRVILNLLDNASYSLMKKKKALGESFIPTILIKTIKKGNKFEIHIRDNGEGIGSNYANKIFTPFFTTKPTGLGAIGLGLSLSHSVIAQQHGGELSFHTKEGEYAEFVISLTRPMEEA